MTTKTDPIPCFFLRPTDLVQYFGARSACETERFPHHAGYGHTAKRETQIIEIPYGNVLAEARPDAPKDWPETCVYCDYQFTVNDRKFLAYERVWIDLADETHWLLSEVPAGAMWYAPWYDAMFMPQLEHVLVVKLPGSHFWIVDSQARNCEMPDDTKMERHHCWNIIGELPAISVIRAEGKTCSPGTGAVQCRSWHGNLREGFLIAK